MVTLVIINDHRLISLDALILIPHDIIAVIYEFVFYYHLVVLLYSSFVALNEVLSVTAVVEGVKNGHICLARVLGLRHLIYFLVWDS